MIDTSSWPESDIKQMAAEIDRLGLHRNVCELDLFGLTVVDASVLGVQEQVSRALERVLDLVEEKTGTRPDVSGGTTHQDVSLPSLHNIVLRDPVFADLLTHPVLLALMTYLVGERGVYAATEVFMKGPASEGNKAPLGITKTDGLQLPLHSDLLMHPEPFAPYAEMCNATWLLSDYSREEGALAFVPGSHRLCRNPRDHEAEDQAVAVEAPRGSLVMWHGNTWHGSFPRKVPGLRTGLAFELIRCYLDRHHVVDEAATAGAPDALARLMGRDLVHWGEEGPDYAKLARRPFRPTLFS